MESGSAFGYSLCYLVDRFYRNFATIKPLIILPQRNRKTETDDPN